MHRQHESLSTPTAISDHCHRLLHHLATQALWYPLWLTLRECVAHEAAQEYP